MQELIDHADAMQPLVPYLAQRQIQSIAIMWDGLRNQVAFAGTALNEAAADSDLIAGTVSLTSGSTATIVLPSVPALLEDQGFSAVWANYVTVTSRPDLLDEVRALLKLFGLDSAPPGEKSSLELLDIAHAAFAAPVSPSNPASTSLLPMREAINAALSSLLTRRPTQEATGHSDSRKVLSIGKQLRRPSISDQTVHAWAEEWHRLNDQLSASKHGQFTREVWAILLTSATRFLHTLLTGLEREKLRR